MAEIPQFHFDTGYEMMNFASLDSRSVDARELLFATTAAMDPRLRNQIIANMYASLSVEFASRIYSNSEPGCRVVPNFYTFAYWGASTVGFDLRRRWAPGARRRALAIEDGNAQVAKTMGQLGSEFLSLFEVVNDGWVVNGKGHQLLAEKISIDAHAEGSTDGSLGLRWMLEDVCGFPPDICPALGDKEGIDDAVASFRALGVQCYLRASLATDLDEKRRHTLEGNAWLASGEQATVNEAVSVALRANLRAWVHPLTVARQPLRRYRELEPVGWRRQLEDFWVSWVTRTMVNFAHPKQLLKVRRTGPFRFISNLFRKRHGLANLSSWFDESTRQSALDSIDALRLKEPYTSFFPVREVPIPPLTCWICYQDRMRVILALFLLTDQEPWLYWQNGQIVHTYVDPWTGYKKAMNKYSDVFEPGDERDG